MRTDFTNLKSNLPSIYGQLADVAQQNAELKQRDVERKNSLLADRAPARRSTVTTPSRARSRRRLQEQLAEQQQDRRCNQLLGDPNLPIEKFPAYMQAAAALDQAQRDLDHTVLRAPIAGIATQVDNIQIGRYVTAGTPVFTMIDDSAPWVDANPKETDITYLRIGQPVTIFVDTFPDRSSAARSRSVSPGTGAQFAILPPQNASGNWVKVVQRVPLRIEFDQGSDDRASCAPA